MKQTGAGVTSCEECPQERKITETGQSQEASDQHARNGLALSPLGPKVKGCLASRTPKRATTIEARHGDAVD